MGRGNIKCKDTIFSKKASRWGDAVWGSENLDVISLRLYPFLLSLIRSLDLWSSLLPLGKADASIALLSLTRRRFNMNMNGFMVIIIEFEDKSKKDKYC